MALTSCNANETEKKIADDNANGNDTVVVVAEENVVKGDETISFDNSWKYADRAVIKSSAVKLYRSTAADKKGKVVAVNAGHGTKGGQTKKVPCHPDGSPKCVSGSTKAGAVTAAAVSGGMKFKNGTGEAVVTLKVAEKLKAMLLKEGYDVLMIRETEDCQLDNIARTVIANNNADIHLAIHFDGSANDKGAFYVGIPDVASYKKMEPVASHWQQHEAFGKALNSGMRTAGVKVWKGETMRIDLCQTSFSTIPSIDYECGDSASDISDAGIAKIARGLLNGINNYFK